MINSILFGDCRDSLRKMAAEGVKAQMCVTSPPYFGLRDYGHDGQIGLEPTPEAYIAELVEVFRCVRDVLADDGTLWVNIGDSYASPIKGSGGAGRSTLGPNRDLQNIEFQKMTPRRFKMGELKQKDLIGIPWMLAFALRADGWYLRQEIIWHKPNPMPESVTDRCTKAHESLFLLAKSPRYYFDALSVKDVAIGVSGGAPRKIHHESAQGVHGATSALNKRWEGCDTRNRRSVWTIATKPYKGAHFAVFPPALIEPCILAGSRPGDVVLDPFMGSATTAEVAILKCRDFIGCELNADYAPLQDERIANARANLAAPKIKGFRKVKPKTAPEIEYDERQIDMFV